MEKAVSVLLKGSFLFYGNIDISGFHRCGKNDLCAGSSELLKMPQEHIQIGGVLKCHLDQLGILTGNAVALQHIGARLNKRIEGAFLMGSHFQADESGDIISQFASVNGHMIALDQAFLRKAIDP